MEAIKHRMNVCALAPARRENDWVDDWTSVKVYVKAIVHRVNVCGKATGHRIKL